jgi:FdhE protein
MTAAAFDTLAVSRPEWQPWLRVFAEARRACADVRWRDFVPAVTGRESTEVARLAGSTIAVDPRVAGDLLRALILAVAEATGPAATLTAPLITNGVAIGVLQASINQDAARLAELAEGLGADLGAFGGVGELAAMPLLHACRETWRAELSEHRGCGYCPVCGAWPALAEACGLERARLLRCGRCGSGWATEWLRCPYCGQRDHESLGALVPEVGGERRKVETCLGCRGYVKTLTALKPSAPLDVTLRDLETLELDVAALERGFTRPPAPGCRLGVTVTPVARGGLLTSLFGHRAR